MKKIKDRFIQYHLQQLGWWSPLEGFPVVASTDEGAIHLYRPKKVNETVEKEVVSLLRQRKVLEAKKLLGV